MYQWSDAAEAFYAPAKIGAGQVVVDFGCGPGHTAVEFAQRVGAAGHVHALDINAEFIKRTQARAEAMGLAERITAQLLTTEQLPLPVLQSTALQPAIRSSMFAIQLVHSRNSAVSSNLVASRMQLKATGV
jgi:ubiquinone/menaquinone biosynthesis C-methylase UbiE